MHAPDTHTPLSLSVPMSRRIGDALAAIFGAESSAKSVTDPWGEMTSKGGCDVEPYP